MTDEAKNINDDYEIPGDIPAPTLEFGAPAPAPQAAQAPAEPAAAKERAELSAQEQAQVDAFVRQIDLTDSTGVLGYGVGAQRKATDFADRVLSGVRGHDLGEIGDDVTTLVVTLKNFDPDPDSDKGIRGLFHRSKNKLDTLKARYSEVEKNVADISDILEGHQRTLLKDISMLDQMYDMNAAYFKELTMYIAAGKEKLAQVRAQDLPALQAKAQASGLPEDAQAARDLAEMCDRFEKRVYDLETTRTVALQTAPQIRLIQSSDQVMAEKIQSTVVNTIPLWKNQMIIALGVEHATQAARAQREVSEMTNDLLKKNADRLHVASVETAKEAERGIVDIETLRHTNEQLISTLDDIMRIQTEGREKRREAEGELAQIEGELKNKLLEASQQK